MIRNLDSLLSNSATTADRIARDLALGALDEVIAASDPMKAVMRNVRVEGKQLLVEKDSYDLEKFERTFVVGAGKASARMAEAVETLLGDRITDGLVNVPRNTASPSTRKIQLNNASHPLPDESGVAGSIRMKNLLAKAKKDDLVICLISGGGSALMPLPTEGLSLGDKQSVTKQLLTAGATINELNAVRKHLSKIKGGWLAKSADGAQILTLILSDVVGDPLDVIASGPTSPDKTTFNDAIAVLRKYDLFEKVPSTVQKILTEGRDGRIPETPKPDDSVFEHVKNYVLFNNRLACEAALVYLRKRGVTTEILTTTMEGESNQVGVMLGSIAKEIASWNRPVAKPAALIAGGETTVTVRGKGTGGRNQEVALGAALRLPTAEGVAVASMGTDGIDGPTDAAGAIVDGRTILRAEAKGLKVLETLANNDSYRFFKNLEDLIFTGPTGTNVNDVAIVVAVSPRSQMPL